MLAIIWAAAALVGCALAVIRGVTWRRTGALVLIGLGLGLAFLISGYLNATPSDQPRDCSDCSDYLGRWWEPGFAIFVIALTFAAWVLGVLVGASIRRLRK
jgi:hypothetical protein